MTITNRSLWDDDEQGRQAAARPTGASRRSATAHGGRERPTTPAQTAPMLLDVDDVCELLRIGRTTVFAAVKTGELPRIKINRRTLFDPADVRAFIERKKQGSDDPIESVGGRTYRRR